MSNFATLVTCLPWRPMLQRRPTLLEHAHVVVGARSALFKTRARWAWPTSRQGGV